MISTKKFITEAVVSVQFLKTANINADEFIKRELAIKAMKSLPISDLEKIFTFEKVTGDDQINPFDSTDKRFKIQEMRNKGQETHIAIILIPYHEIDDVEQFVRKRLADSVEDALNNHPNIVK